MHLHCVSLRTQQSSASLGKMDQKSFSLWWVCRLCVLLETDPRVSHRLGEHFKPSTPWPPCCPAQAVGLLDTRAQYSVGSWTRD